MKDLLRALVELAKYYKKPLTIFLVIIILATGLYIAFKPDANTSKSQKPGKNKPAVQQENPVEKPADPVSELITYENPYVEFEGASEGITDLDGSKLEVLNKEVYDSLEWKDKRRLISNGVEVAATALVTTPDNSPQALARVKKYMTKNGLKDWTFLTNPATDNAPPPGEKYPISSIKIISIKPKNDPVTGDRLIEMYYSKKWPDSDAIISGRITVRALNNQPLIDAIKAEEDYYDTPGGVGEYGLDGG